MKFLSLVLAFVTAAAVGSACIFSYAGLLYHNTDPALTAFVWLPTLTYVALTAIVTRRAFAA